MTPATSVKRLVNIPLYSWTARGPNGGDVNFTARRGEIIEVSPEEAKRGESLTFVHHWDNGAGHTLFREESALLDPASQEQAARRRADALAKAARIEAELEAARHIYTTALEEEMSVPGWDLRQRAGETAV